MYYGHNICCLRRSPGGPGGGAPRFRRVSGGRSPPVSQEVRGAQPPGIAGGAGGAAPRFAGGAGAARPRFAGGFGGRHAPQFPKIIANFRHQFFGTNFGMFFENNYFYLVAKGHCWKKLGRFGRNNY